MTMRLQTTFDYIKSPKRLPHIMVYLLGIVFIGFAYSVNAALQLTLIILTATSYLFSITELLSIIMQQQHYFQKNRNDIIITFISSLLITIINLMILQTNLWSYILGLTVVMTITTQIILFTRRIRN